MNLVDLVAKIYYDGSDESRELVEALESMYFCYIRSSFRPLGTSEEFKIAKDVVRLNEHLTKARTVVGFRPRSRLMQNHPLIKQYITTHVLQEDEIKAVRLQVIQGNRHMVAAAMIADRFNQERIHERFRWFVAVLISLVSIIATVLLKSS